MSRWPCLTRVRWRVVVTRQWFGRPRLLSTHSSVEHVRVPCASAGHITVSLHNVSNHDTSTPLVIVLPPFSRQETSSASQLPSCFQDYPTAVINYRWQGQEQKGDERPEHPLHWPTPLHDVNFGYSWIMNNLGSGTDASATPRPAYVYGSYLGASLAAGLALTESHVPAPSQPMTVCGLIAYNGIYNWTMFLPDHPVQRLRSKSSSRRRRRGLASPFTNLNEDPIEEEGIFTDLKHHAPGLFAEPSNLFDPFASACFFFHSANLHVPDDFTTPLSASGPVSTLSSEFTAAIDALANPSPSPSTSAEGGGGKGEEEDGETAAELLSRAAHLAKQQKPPRKGYLVFPPRDSTLRLPPALFLYSSPQYGPHPPAGSDSSSRNRRKQSRNSFAAQTAELAGLMMRSLDRHELRRRGGGGGGTGRPGKQFPPKGITAGANATKEEGEGVADGEEEDRWKEIERRVQTFEVPLSSSLSSSPSSFSFEEGLGLDGEAEQVIAEWLREKIDEDFGGEEGRNGS
ncbi:hypothetical protein VTG60DRAFT_393 [Thermothelomyces hinnuleus]